MIVIGACAEINSVFIIAELDCLNQAVLALNIKLSLSSLVKGRFDCVAVKLERTGVSAVLGRAGAHPKLEGSFLVKGEISLIVAVLNIVHLRELNLVLCDNLAACDGMGGGKEVQEGGDRCYTYG